MPVGGHVKGQKRARSLSLRGVGFATKQSPMRRWGLLRYTTPRNDRGKLSSRTAAKQSPIHPSGIASRTALAMTGWVVAQGLCKVGHGRLKPQQHIPEAALRRLECSLRRQAWGICCCDLSRPAACQATLPGSYGMFTQGRGISVSAQCLVSTPTRLFPAVCW